MGRREAALLGDESSGRQQVVLRRLERRAFASVSAVSGCALMGDQSGLMLDLDGLAAFLKPAGGRPHRGRGLRGQGAGVATKPARGWLMGIYIAFAVAAEKSAIAVEQIQEIYHYQKAVRAPHAPPHLLGLVNLRGRVIPVMDLRRRQGMGPSQPGSSEMIVIAPTPAAPQLGDKFTASTRLIPGPSPGSTN
ncbi:MAG: chemotaxis protein CheW [Pseudomonadota bacterium]